MTDEQKRYAAFLAGMGASDEAIEKAIKKQTENKDSEED